MYITLANVIHLYTVHIRYPQDKIIPTTHSISQINPNLSYILQLWLSYKMLKRINILTDHFAADSIFHNVFINSIFTCSPNLDIIKFIFWVKFSPNNDTRFWPLKSISKIFVLTVDHTNNPSHEVRY